MLLLWLAFGDMKMSLPQTRDVPLKGSCDAVRQPTQAYGGQAMPALAVESPPELSAGSQHQLPAMESGHFESSGHGQPPAQCS